MSKSSLRILVATTSVPFVKGGATNFVEWLTDALRKRGHEVENLTIPFSDSPMHLVSQLNALRAIEIPSTCDLLIPVRPPAYALRHHNKVPWFIHHLRGFYDLWGTPFQSVQPTPEGIALRESLMRFDTTALLEAKQIFTNSSIVTDRLLHFNGLLSDVLYPPLPESFAIEASAPSDYICSISRIEHHKRQELFIRAIAVCETPVRLVVRGKGSTPAVEDHLSRVIDELGIGDRVDFRPGWISECEKKNLFRSCLANVYAPFDEDSYGYPVLEAAAACKPTVTTTDSGGVLEFVRDEQNGLVVGSTPEEVAQAFDELYRDRERAVGLGRAAKDTIGELGINWDTVCDRLTASY